MYIYIDVTIRARQCSHISAASLGALKTRSPEAQRPGSEKGSEMCSSYTPVLCSHHELGVVMCAVCLRSSLRSICKRHMAACNLIVARMHSQFGPINQIMCCSGLNWLSVARSAMTIKCQVLMLAMMLA